MPVPYRPPNLLAPLYGPQDCTGQDNSKALTLRLQDPDKLRTILFAGVERWFARRWTWQEVNGQAFGDY